jgi:glycosyltransferase involved in cell wall biosynthesis
MMRNTEIKNSSGNRGIVITGMVSTIIPVYNRANLLEEAVESVIAQTYRPIEIIIVDDGSTDHTTRKIIDLTQKYSEIITTIRQSTRGPGIARETGRLLAKGEFIQYLDSDDLLLSTKFEQQVESLRMNPKAGIAYGKTHHSGVGDQLQPIPFKRTGEHFETLFPALLISRWWATSTPLYRRTVTDSIGPWQPLKNEEDWEYDARAGALDIKLCYCDNFVSVHRWHSGERLHLFGCSDVSKLAHRAVAHKLIYKHARHANINQSMPEMQHFARELFLLSRQCGAAGLSKESKELFQISKEASGEKRSKGLDYKMYQYLAFFFGWSNVGKAACFLDKLRPMRLL